MHDLKSSAIRIARAALLAGCLVVVFLSPLSAQNAGTGGPPAGSGQPGAPAPAPSPAPAPAETTRPAPPVVTAQPAVPAVNPVTKAAVQSGVLTCVSRINQVMTFLTAAGKSSAYLFLPQKQPDQSIFSVSLAVEGEKVTNKYASASFAPTTNGEASAVYDSVEYVTQSIADVETKTFKDLKRKGALGKDIVVLDGGPVSVFLMPAGSGCIIIKKEVVQ